MLKSQADFSHILGKEPLWAEKLYAKFLPEANFYNQNKNLWDQEFIMEILTQS